MRSSVETRLDSQPQQVARGSRPCKRVRFKILAWSRRVQHSAGLHSRTGMEARAQPPEDPQAQEVCARHDGASCTDLKIFYTKSADCGCTANLEYFAILKGAGGGLVSAGYLLSLSD